MRIDFSKTEDYVVISKIEKRIVNTNQKQTKRLMFYFTSYIELF